MAIQAKISSGTVVNIQITNSGDVLDSNFTWVDITNLSPQPGVGWSYDGTNFTAPVVTPVALTIDEIIQANQNFGAALIRQAIAYNSNRGLTSTQRLQLQTALLPVAISLMIGDLTNAQTAIGNLTVDGTLITSTLVSTFTNAITAYLEG